MGFSAHIPGAEISTHKASLLTDTGLTVDMDKERVCSIRAVQVTKMNRDFIPTLLTILVFQNYTVVQTHAVVTYAQ